MSIAEKYAAQWQPNGEVSLADLIQAAVDEAVESRRHEVAMHAVQQIKAEIGQSVPVAKTAEDEFELLGEIAESGGVGRLPKQSVPVVGEVTLPLAQLAYERAFGESEDIDFCLRIARNVAALIHPAHSIPAAELATLRENLAKAEQARDELRKDAERYRWLRTGDNDEQCIHFTNDCPAGTDTVWIHRNEKLDAIIDAAFAQGKGE